MKIVNLNLKLGNKVVLNNINLDIPSDKIIGLVGSNGSGKTSLFRCISDLTSTYTGVINKRNITIALNLNNSGFFNSKSGFQNLEFYKNLKDLPVNTIKTPLDNSFLQKKISNMSLGMRQMVSLMETLQNRADVYLFDEPFNGLDIIHRNVLMKKIIELKNENKTIIISSHEISVLESIIEDIILIKNGIIKYEGSVSSILNKQLNLENAIIKLLYD